MDIISVIENLMPNILTVVTQLCATFIMFVLLKKFAWKPVREILNKRSEYEQKKLEEADRLKEENAELKKQLEAELAKADEKAQEEIEKARKEGQDLKESIINEAKEKSEKLIADARADIELEHNKMLEDAQKEIVDASITAAEKILNRKINSESENREIDAFIKEVVGK